MLFNFPLFSIAFVVGGVLGLVFAVVLLFRPSAPGKLPFTIFLLAISVWTICRTFEAGGVDFATKVFWGKMMLLGTVNSGVMWFCFAQDYTGSGWWKRPRNLALLYVIPVATLAVIWTNQWTGWMWGRIYFSPDNNSVLVWEHNFWFYLYGTYEYVIIAVGTLMLWRSALKREGRYRRQVVTITLGIIFPVICNLIYVFGFSPIKGLDLTPFGFLISGTIYIVTIFRLGFLDIVPVARVTLVENLPDGILVVNSDNHIVDINPSAVRLLGLANLPVLGKRLGEVCPKLDMYHAAQGSTTQTESVFDVQGASIYLSISVTPIKEDKNNITGRLIVLRDITQRRLMEQTLRESESRYAALVEQSNEGVVIIQDGIYKYANRTFSTILGYPVEEIIGQKLPFAAADEDAEMVLTRNRLRLEGKPVPNVYELKFKRKDRQIVEAEISVGTVFYDGQPAHMVTVRDVSERKITQRKLEAAYQEEIELRRSLQEEIDKRSKYTRSLVHELRTPLTAILASSEMLEAEIQAKIPLALVKNIRRASLNLEMRINELIELARGEIGILKINPMPLDMAELVKEIVSEMTPVAAGKKLVIRVQIPDLPLVIGDRSRLRQVMTNLLSNAIKFTSQGGVEVTASRYGGDEVVVHVKDTGHGIAAERIEHIFDPYRRKSNEGQELSGLGIGLALSKIFIDLHKGKIWVESSPAGSTFSFSVPVYHDEKV
jgi:PAS domain S-box-containing protein